MINFFSEDVDFELTFQERTIAWIGKLKTFYGVDIQHISYVFCSDEYLLNLNKKHLNHDYYTDIITFDMRDVKGAPIEADIFVSIDRVMDNADSLDKPFEMELNRVIVHGLLHLIGYGDKTEADKAEMRVQEDKCLSLLVHLEE